MPHSISTWRPTAAARLAPSMLAGMALVLTVTGVHAEDRCRPVNGHCAEHTTAAPTGCSPRQRQL